MSHRKRTSHQYLFHRVREKRVFRDRAIFGSNQKEVIRCGDSKVIIGDNIYDCGFVFGSVLEDSYRAIEADCY
jgi:hypothetical protein